MFGGSSVWGMYVRDEHTLASLVSTELNKLPGKRIRVTNFSERGSLFNQEVAHLIKLLQSGKRPHTVIFYDGVNDVMTAYYYGMVGASAFTSNLEELLEIRRASYPQQIGLLTKSYVERSSLLFKVLDRATFAILRTPRPNYGRVVYHPGDLQRLGAEVASFYARTYELLELLSKEYHFQYFCFLQPVIFTKSHLTDEELTSDWKNTNEEVRTLYSASYDSLRALTLPCFYDVSRVFANTSDSYYIDWCHLSEEGNAIVADELVRHLKDF